MIVNGNNFNIRIDGEILAHATSVSLEISRELIPVTLSASNAFTERIPGTRDGNLSFEGFYDLATTRYTPGTLVDWRFEAPGGVFLGQAYIGSISYHGGTDSAPTRSGEMETTGEIAFEAQESVTLCVLGETLCVDGESLTANI